MTSLWKKLDFTLNQIKSLQNSPAIAASQRTRSRIGVENMARQRVLAVASAGGVLCSSVSETRSILSPAHTSHSMLGHSTPVCYTGTRPALGSGTLQQIADGSRLINTPRESPVQIIVSEHRLNPGPMSPGRRKWETPRKRGGALSGSSGPGRSAVTASSVSADPQPEEQLVIQNARDKILGDRSLQEKLAENINKILANEPVPQTPKAATVEADQSIDEILGLQGEIHMSDDAIHDILEQTESDPAFQALFDLFDYNKTRFTDGEPGEGDVGSSPEENDTAGPSSTVRPPDSGDQGAIQTEENSLDSTPVAQKMRAGQERKTRKSTAPIVFKKTVLGPSGRSSRIENSSARLLVSQGNSSAAVDSSRKEKASSFSNSAVATPMDIDEPLNTPPLFLDSFPTEEPITTNSPSTTAALCDSAGIPSSRDSAAFAEPENISSSTLDKTQEQKQAQESEDLPATALSNQPASLPPAQVQLNTTPLLTAKLPHTSHSSSDGDSLLVSAASVTPASVSATAASAFATVTAASPTSASTTSPFTATPGSPTSASTSATLTATPASSTPASPTSSSACIPVAPDPSTTNSSTPSKAAADSSNIVALKIIISDNQDENSSSDTVLNQAVSSISGDHIPTIYLSSPAKSPGPSKGHFDEVAQAVSGLQRSEAHASPFRSKAGSVISSPLAGTSQAQQSYIIQLPLDAANPALQGATASYFLVTEPPTTDVQPRQVLLPATNGQPLPTNQYGVTTATPSQGFSTGALILPSPVKPMMLPVNVVGQNPVGQVQVVSNQLVAIPNPLPAQQKEAVKPKPLSVATKQSPAAGAEKNLAVKAVHPVLSENTSQQDAAKGPSHRRILMFDSSSQVQPQTSKTATPTAPNTSTSQSVQQTGKDDKQSGSRTRPTILGGNKPKRRIETVRCSAETSPVTDSVKDFTSSQQQQQQDLVKKNARKQNHTIHNKESQIASTSSTDVSQAEVIKNPESGMGSKSVDRKHNLDVRNDEAKSKDSHSSRSLSSGSVLKSGSRKDKEESSRKEPAEKAPLKSREGRTEKRISSQEMPNVTANKENEMKGHTQEQQSPLSSLATKEFSPAAVTQQTSNTQSKTTKSQSMTSSLAKQAAEMLQDIQGLGSPCTRPGAGSSDFSLPGSSHNQEGPADSPRTPSRQKKGKDGEATPKRLLPPNTPDVPTCSPASEAGSENSINMAAHTLMILSRAAIARTGSPLKDSLRQEGVGEKSPTSSKNSKKRKQSSPTASPPAKKDTTQSPNKKKDRERKKLVDCFPHDLDVDKFLSSLHYDE